MGQRAPTKAEIARAVATLYMEAETMEAGARRLALGGTADLLMRRGERHWQRGFPEACERARAKVTDRDIYEVAIVLRRAAVVWPNLAHGLYAVADLLDREFGGHRLAVVA